MSDNNDNVSFFSDRRAITSTLIILLITTFGITSLINREMFAETSMQTDILAISLIIFGYVLVISFMKLFNPNPNKLEMFFIPTVFILIVIVGLNTLNVEIIPEDRPPVVTSVTSQASDVFSTNPTTTDGPITDQGYEIGDDVINQGINGFNTIFIGIVLAVIFVVSVFFIVSFLINREKNLPLIHITKEIKYSKNLAIHNKEIMEFYTDASLYLEKLKGKAPKWFSPTGFSGKIQLNPGPPVADYFEHLTELYELARFSLRAINEDDVAEALELHAQVVTWAKKATKEVEKGWI